MSNKKEHLLITGASGGIGQATAKALASSSRILYLHYHKNRERILQVKHTCENLGAEVFILQADLSTRDGTDQLIAQIPTNIDALVYHAGMDSVQLFTDISDETLLEVMQVHLYNPMRIARQLLKGMIRNQKGKLIFVSSIWGLAGASCEVTYSAAKGGINAFVKALAKEVALSNIQVNAIAPGAIDTGMLTRYNETDRQQLIDEIPAGRLGESEEVAAYITFLLTEQASYINGQILSINGAWYT
ncbi:elongation factor P 5-aminopentanone reductase [Alkalihalobacillus pseudalcaliphilus]|uniref:elongation factor P 5-aminopentanone reductase n=1 Tax=Alkalihalobacillus pseudalcaliphilus TaxID=79884 RepID=UPI00064DB3C2|nr:SDR family NAD(P)-dependent oxidoreductase [Alkalihalobacillus pseudalcaliphilus]KMK77277.1 3-ketoacyl-ACP reductase [Alkalihalobacillus pseudalcaliphilus]